MRKIDTIIVHHSASSENTTALEIREWHLKRGFSDIGYHYVIERNGTIIGGRPLSKIGAHCTGSNMHSIGICLCGNFVVRIVPQEQLQSLKKLIKALRLVFSKDLLVCGHRDFANTLCPGDNLYREIGRCMHYE